MNPLVNRMGGEEMEERRCSWTQKTIPGYTHRRYTALSWPVNQTYQYVVTGGPG